MNSLKRIFLVSLVVATSSLAAEVTMKTWFGDPDLQGTWTNASLTTLERPDNYESLVVTEEQALAAASSTAEFIEEIDNPMKRENHPKPEKTWVATILLGLIKVPSYLKSMESTEAQFLFTLKMGSFLGSG